MATETLPDLSDLGFWAQPPAAREAGFAALRDAPGLTRHRQPQGTLMPEGGGTGGFYAAVRYEDVRHVSRTPEVFCSGQGIMLEDIAPELLDAAQSIIAMDGERHSALRRLVWSAFTPKQVKRLEDGVRADVADLLDGLEEAGAGDWVDLVARPLPLRTIMRMLGVPEADRDELVHQADAMVSWNDPEYLAGRTALEVAASAIGTLHGACQRYCAERRAQPGDDLLSALTHAEVDGRRLTDLEIAAFFVLLCVAGNDTTRHTTSHTVLALSEHPEQAELLRADPSRMDVAVEEFLRWASPVMTMRRTATRDAEVAGQPIAAGEKVVLFYPSANRDERAFPDPHRFDVTRTPNRHLAFGGGGPHYCLGASLARTQLRVLFGELLRRFPDVRASEPDWLVGNFVNGVRHLHVQV